MNNAPSDFARFTGFMFAIIGGGYGLIALALYLATTTPFIG